MANRNAQVLVVDDEPELRELLVDALSDLDITVATAGSGQEALDMARRSAPDLLVTDFRLGDCTGLDVIDGVRRSAGYVPAVVITGYADSKMLTDASSRRPVGLLTKPLNIECLRRTVRDELDRRSALDIQRRRAVRLRRLARAANLRRKHSDRQLHKTCQELSAAYRTLSTQLAQQEIVIEFQRDLISSRTDDDVFRSLFRLFAHCSGPTYGIAMACDAEAELRIVGRFGVPYPDGVGFCRELCKPVIDAVLVNPRCTLMDAGEEPEQFHPEIRRRLVGLTILSIPLIPEEGKMIGLVVLYRKGEQPFTDQDVALAKAFAAPTALAIRRND